jgi:hypothetical protein
MFRFPPVNETVNRYGTVPMFFSHPRRKVFSQPFLVHVFTNLLTLPQCLMCSQSTAYRICGDFTRLEIVNLENGSGVFVQKDVYRLKSIAVKIITHVKARILRRFKALDLGLSVGPSAPAVLQSRVVLNLLCSL